MQKNNIKATEFFFPISAHVQPLKSDVKYIFIGNSCDTKKKIYNHSLHLLYLLAISKAKLYQIGLVKRVVIIVAMTMETTMTTHASQWSNRYDIQHTKKSCLIRCVIKYTEKKDVRSSETMMSRQVSISMVFQVLTDVYLLDGVKFTLIH